MVRNLNKRVLVVDDEEIVRESCRRALNEAGYSVHTAASGRDALQACRAEPFDLMFTDLRMPDMDGLEVTRAVKQEFPEVRIVIITGYPSRNSAEQASNLGIFDYLEKPISPERLSEATAAALARKTKWTASVSVPEESEQEPLTPETSTRDAADPVAKEPGGVLQTATRTGAAPTEPSAATSPVDTPAPVPVEVTEGDIGTLKALGLLAVAPILGLAFVIFLPVIGFGMLFVSVASGLFGKPGWSQR